MDNNQFSSGTWQPEEYGPGTRLRYFNPVPPGSLPQRQGSGLDYVQPLPLPGVEPRPYVPPEGGAGVIDDRPGFVPGTGYYGPGLGGGGMGPRQLFGGLYGGGEGGWLNLGGGLLSGLAGSALFGPAGGFLGSLLYRRIFDDGRAQRDPLEMMEIFGYNYDEMGGKRNPMQSRQREGSTRFSSGEMDLSNLPMYGAPGSLLPAVFAGERGSAMPGGGQAPVVEQR